MKIISYNVNGIRAALSKGLANWIQSVDADIICFQESKAQLEQIDTEQFISLGYESFWFSAQKKGYSGVGIASKIPPKHVEYGIGIDYMDFEGRIIRLDFEDFSVFSVYVPSATNISRLDIKMQFCYDFLEYLKNFRKINKNIIVCGDFNICHNEIDIHDPVRLSNVSGFLPIEREFLTKFLQEGNFIDSFRYKNPSTVQYSWWSYRANSRANNKGWRIDYNMFSYELQNIIENSTMLPDAKHSDHCPVLTEFNV